MFGQLLEHYSMQPDFDKFDVKRTPDAMINNFTRLQARAKHVLPEHVAATTHGTALTPGPSRTVACTQTTFQKLGVKFDSRTANAVMREEPGVALRLLYALRQSLGQVQKDVTVRTLPMHEWHCSLDGVKAAYLHVDSAAHCRSSRRVAGWARSWERQCPSQGHYWMPSSTIPLRKNILLTTSGACSPSSSAAD